MTGPTILSRLEEWYRSQCNGDWEHGKGVAISTLDNPGWSVQISLADTDLQSRPFDRVNIERSADDWLHAWVEEDAWNAAAGPLNLNEAFATFLSWAGS